MMAMTSLCHFCDHLSRCKSAAEDCPRPPVPLPPIHWRIRLATVAFPPVQLPDVCLPPLPHATRNQHTTQHLCEALRVVGESACSVWNAMWFSGSTCFNCTVWFNWGKRCEERCVWERVQVWAWSLKVFGQWVIFVVVLALWARTLNFKLNNSWLFSFKGFCKVGMNLIIRCHQSNQCFLGPKTCVISNVIWSVICVSVVEDQTESKKKHKALKEGRCSSERHKGRYWVSPNVCRS